MTFLTLLLVFGGWILADLRATGAIKPAPFAAAIVMVAIAILLMPVWVAAAIVPMRLALDAEGFNFTRFPFRPRRFAWRDVSGIDVVSAQGVARIVWITTRAGLYHRTARAILGYDGGLPAGWSVSARDIADAMTRFASGPTETERNASRSKRGSTFAASDRSSRLDGRRLPARTPLATNLPVR